MNTKITKINLISLSQSRHPRSLREMSQDLVKSIQNLIDSGVGDKARLGSILNTIKQGKPLPSFDQKYLESVIAGYSGRPQNELKSETTHRNSQPKFCGKCGSSILSSNDFCTQCGFSVKNVSNQQSTIPDNKNLQSRPTNITSTNRKTVRKAVIGVIVAIIPIIILIYAMVNYTIPGVIESHQKVIEANNDVNSASINVLNTCGDLYDQYKSAYLSPGPGSEQFNQFMQSSSDGIKSCKTSLQSVQDSCKSVPSMQICSDSRLQELSSEFSLLNP